VNILIVYAHHEPSSFTAAMKNLATQILARQGHAVTISDLYGLGFNPAAQKWDFVTTSGNHFNYMMEQKHAAQLNMAFAPDITGEISKIQAADVVLIMTPLWWHSVPAILKGWFDRVLAMGFAWDSGQFYEKGLLRGKQVMLACAVGHPAEYYQPAREHKATINQYLHPINYGTLAFCGFNVHEPYVAFNVLGMDQTARDQALRELQFRIEHLIDSPNWLVHYTA
jgi:NAD(P)H dehydrogenase (quinone)